MGGKKRDRKGEKTKQGVERGYGVTRHELGWIWIKNQEMEIVEGRGKKVNREPGNMAFYGAEVVFKDLWLAGGFVYCKPEVKLILECLRAEMEIGRVEIRQCTVVIWEKTAGFWREVSVVHSYANSTTRHGYRLTVYRTCSTITISCTSLCPLHSEVISIVFAVIFHPVSYSRGTRPKCH